MEFYNHRHLISSHKGAGPHAVTRGQQRPGNRWKTKAQTMQPARDLTETRLTFIGACYKLGFALSTIRNSTKFKGRDGRLEPMQEWNGVKLRGQFFRSAEKRPKTACLEVERCQK